MDKAIDAFWPGLTAVLVSGALPGRSLQRGAAASRRRYDPIPRKRMRSYANRVYFWGRFHTFFSLYSCVRVRKIYNASDGETANEYNIPLSTLYKFFTSTTRFTIDSPSSRFWAGDSISPSNGTSRMTSFMLAVVIPKFFKRRWEQTNVTGNKGGYGPGSVARTELESRTLSASYPVSSRSSRIAAASGVSPSSISPAGSSAK